MIPVLNLAECADRGPEVGGKALGLGALIGLGLPVPGGFCVTTDAYRAAVRDGGLVDRIAALVATADFHHDTRAMSAAVRELFDGLEMPSAIAEEIVAAYEALGPDVAVAVRSSATAEDRADASFAGQQDTYLHVHGAEQVLQHVRRCWGSLYSPQAIGYRSRFEIADEDLAMAVVVQRMVPAHAAGVMMTLHPVTGDRSRIFVEAGYGLGEGVVRGDVGSDRFEVAKNGLEVVERAIGRKDQAHRFDPELDTVRLVEVPEADRDRPCLSEDEVLAVARLGLQVEEAFGAPMDVEWALDEGADGEREVLLLQARPETVWSQRDEPDGSAPGAGFEEQAAAVDPAETWDVLHTASDEATNWTTSNIGEAMPGVMTPLGWSLWHCSEGVFRGVIADMGVLTARERLAPARADEWIMRAFYGRIAWQVDFFAVVGDRMPGTSAEEVSRSLLGRVPDGLPSSPTRRHYPAIAARLPVTALRAPREARTVAADTATWYRDVITRVPDMDLDEARRTVTAAVDAFARVLTAQGHVTFGVIQPLYDAVEKLVEKTGIGDAGILSGSGGVEVSGMLGDLWETAHGRMSREEVVLRHGYHGPREGEVSSHPWREDPAPLERILAEYEGRPESEGPKERERASHAERERVVAELLAALPAWQRPAVRVLLAQAAKQIPLRGVAKVGMLQSVDACRAAARRIGHLLEEADELEDAEDVFMLTTSELSGPLPRDARDLVEKRRERHALYAQLTIPGDWRGMPAPVAASRAAQTATSDAAGVDTVTGIGVSRGVVEGPARVVLEADFAEVDPGEILVAPTTDPSWASIMFVSSGLVVDIGGALSHAAVVARELGLPCVVNTRTGTAAIRTGDIIRVDGGSGTVDILERVGQPVTAAAADPAEAPQETAHAREDDLPASDTADVGTLRVLRLKGMADADAVAAALGGGSDEAEASLAVWEASGACETTRRGYRLTASGREVLDERLADERSSLDEDALADLYERFTEFNTRFKQIASDWQQRDGEPNEHADAVYDGEVLDRLRALHEPFMALLDDLVGVVPRLAPYPRRFSTALGRIDEGDNAWLLRPISDSYHTVWFELHEELIGLRGLTREAEARAGRAE